MLANINAERENLLLYIQTSVAMYDYLTEIEKLIDVLIQNLSIITPEFHKNNFFKFAEATLDLIKFMDEETLILENKIKAFYEQSKGSLEWNYEAGTTAEIPLVFFRKCVSELRGQINTAKGKGSHFAVEFKLFQIIVGMSQKSKSAVIRGSTLKGAIELKKSIIENYFNFKYIICFFNYDNEEFHKTFVSKYGKLFAL